MSRFSTPLLIMVVLSAVLTGSCNRKSTPPGDAGSGTAPRGQSMQAPCIIYKTRADYSHNVPVTLSADKSRIVAYPGTRDLYINGGFSYPVKLEEGFLLDNRGIGPDVAFLSFTYEEYSKLEQNPTAALLFEKIIDKDPLTVMYECGNRSEYKDLEGDLNRIISEGDLTKFRQLK